MRRDDTPVWPWRARRIAAYATMMMLGGCNVLDFVLGGDTTIRGRYTLTTVDGHPVPCCAQTDSTGARVTVVSGTLILGDAVPEDFVTTPAGLYPGSCVHEVPNGSVVKQDQFPRCGDGPYTMTTTLRYDFANGTSRVDTVTSSGLYAWSDHSPRMIKLVDAPMLGDINSSGQDTDISLQRVTFQGSVGSVYDYRVSR